MKLTTKTSALRQNIAAVSGIVPNRPAIQILNNILVHVEPGRISLTASSQEQFMTVWLDSETEGEGDFCIDARSLGAIVKTTTFDDVEIEIADGQAEISSGFSSYNLPVQDAKDFPSPQPFSGNSASVEIDTNEFCSALSKVMYAVSQDSTLRPVMGGVWLDIDASGKLSISASDTHVLAATSTQTPCEVPGEISAVIPLKAAMLIRNTLATEPKLTMSIGENQIEASNGDNKLSTVLIRGKHPEIGRVIPKTRTREVEVGIQDLLTAIGSVSVVSNTSDAVRLKFGHDAVKLSIVNTDLAQSAKTKCACNLLSGEEISIACNVKLLTATLKSMEGEKAMIYMEDPSRPMVLHPCSDSETTHLVMPLNIADGEG